MIIYGNLGTAPEKHTSASGKPYYRMRIAENWGKDDKKKTIWFEVSASISPKEADALEVGAGVAVDGRLDAEAYLSWRALGNVPVPTTWEGVNDLLKRKKALCVGLKLISKDVRPHSVTEDGKALEPAQESPKARITSLLREQADITARVATLQKELPGAVGTGKMTSIVDELNTLSTRSHEIKVELEGME